jgi:hypothetical protein
VDEASRGSGDTGRPSAKPEGSLRDEVREAMRAILRDPGASAAAKASAGRTLVEFFEGAENGPGGGRRSTEMTADELDQEIAKESARLTKRR